MLKILKKFCLFVCPIQSETSFSILHSSSFWHSNTTLLSVIEWGVCIWWGFKHQRIQPISFRDSKLISQSNFSNLENRSKGVLRHGVPPNGGFKSGRIQQFLKGFADKQNAKRKDNIKSEWECGEIKVRTFESESLGKFQNKAWNGVRSYPPNSLWIRPC